MKRLKIDILGVSDTHWNIDMPESFEQDDYVVISSSRKDELHRQGVAIIAKSIAQYITDFNTTSERLMSITMHTKNGPLTIFQVYPPDSSYNDNVIDTFYQNLQEELYVFQTLLYYFVIKK